MPLDADICAYADHRRYATHLMSGTGNGAYHAFHDYLVDNLVAEGWSITSQITDANGRKDTKVQSAQAPWGGDLLLAPPSYYVGRAKLRIFGDSFTNPQIKTMTVDETVQQSASVNFPLNTGFTFQSFFNPFQLYINRQNSSLEQSYLFGTPHLPPFLHTLLEVREAVWSIAISRTRLHQRGGMSGGSDINFLYFKTASGEETISDLGGSIFNSGFLVPWGAGMGSPSGERVANLIDDPALVDPSKWYPLCFPAAILVRTNATPAGPIRWYPWDMIGLSKEQPTVDALLTLDFHIWQAVTFNNLANDGGTHSTLYVCRQGIDCP